eukprot:166487_1
MDELQIEESKYDKPLLLEDIYNDFEFIGKPTKSTTMIIGNPDIEKIKIKDSLIPMQISMQEYEENKNNKSFNIVQSAVKFYEMDHEVTIVRDTKNETPKIYDLDEVYASKQDKCPLSQKYLSNVNDKQKIDLQCGHIFDIFSLQSQQLSALQKKK